MENICIKYDALGKQKRKTRLKLSNVKYTLHEHIIIIDSFGQTLIAKHFPQFYAKMFICLVDYIRKKKARDSYNS